MFDTRENHLGVCFCLLTMPLFVAFLPTNLRQTKTVKIKNITAITSPVSVSIGQKMCNKTPNSQRI